MALEDRKEIGHILRLRNLPWDGSTLDIRRYFSGLSIPVRGVEIVGGNEGNAFITFSTDEDARQAMERNGGYIKRNVVSITLSSKCEVLAVRERAVKENELLRQLVSNETQNLIPNSTLEETTGHMEENLNAFARDRGVKRPHDCFQPRSTFQTFTQHGDMNANNMLNFKSRRTVNGINAHEFLSPEFPMVSLEHDQKNGHEDWGPNGGLRAPEQEVAHNPMNTFPLSIPTSRNSKMESGQLDDLHFLPRLNQVANNHMDIVLKEQSRVADFQRSQERLNDSISLQSNFQGSHDPHLFGPPGNKLTQQHPPPHQFGALPQIPFLCPPPPQSMPFRPPFDPMMFTTPTRILRPPLPPPWKLQPPPAIQMQCPHPPRHSMKNHYPLNKFNHNNTNVLGNAIATPVLDAKRHGLQNFPLPEHNFQNPDVSCYSIPHYNACTPSGKHNVPKIKPSPPPLVHQYPNSNQLINLLPKASDPLSLNSEPAQLSHCSGREIDLQYNNMPSCNREVNENLSTPMNFDFFNSSK